MMSARSAKIPSIPLTRDRDGVAELRTDTARLPNGLFVASRSLALGAAWIAAWRDLSCQALVPNLFFDPDFALAARPVFGNDVQVLIVSDRPPEELGARFLALWPYRVTRRWGVPIPVLMGWTHRFCLFGTPLLAAEQPEAALSALLDAPHALRLARRLLFTYVPKNGPFAECLNAVLARRDADSARYWAHERACLVPSGPDYLTHMSSRKRSKLRQQRRRLEAKGSVVFETAREPTAVASAVDGYIRLESASWKGRAGTAIGCDPAEERFFRAAVAAMAAQGRVRIDRLLRGDQLLAASVAFQTGSTLWYLKISFDETEAKNSPGFILVEAVTENVLEDDSIKFGDSCAPPNYLLMETFWNERLALTNLLVEAPGSLVPFPIAARLEGARERAIRAVLALRARLQARRAGTTKLEKGNA